MILIMLIITLAFVGLCLGSFINALVWRIYMQDQLSQQAGSKSAKKSKKKPSNLKSQISNIDPRKYSILHGRSMCVHCQHELAWYDLVPVFSWLSVGGKCRYCHRPISWQYPVVEIITSMLFVLSYVSWPMGLDSWLGVFNLAIWMILLVGLIALAVYDIRWMLLPNKLVYPMIILVSILAVANILFQPAGIDTMLAIKTAASLLVASGVFYLIFQLSDGRWIGGGDVKLGIIIGLLLQSPIGAFMVIFLSSVLGTLFIAPGLALGKFSKKSKIPFGPFLIAATILVYLFGQSLVDWYLSSVLLLG